MVISTDTAFLVGALALIGPRVAGRLRVFLLALAVVDDIGALSIIALAYTEDFDPMPLAVAALGLVGVWCTRYPPRTRGPTYVTLAVVVWFAFLASGVHPTLAGVAIALLVPVYRPDPREVEQALEMAHTFRQSPNGSAVVLRLLRIGDFGPGLTLDRISGGGALCGIGFTISLFIVGLAIEDPATQNEARVGVLAASVIAFVLARSCSESPTPSARPRKSERPCCVPWIRCGTTVPARTTHH
ncbi:Na+/H+ antiporter NhaA [Rhodococcus gannanensis]|uniref:Na+/H+ antiporter NhaA n=1 Tax=Rhodococcus gannanensis TaxID=1960308 RepID=A0ABW4P7X7_9NOCA